jgi:hypothetical protein
MTKESTSARHAPRIETTLAAELIPTGEGGARGAAVPVTTRDLGAGGALCEVGRSVPAGGLYLFRVDLPGGAGGRKEQVELPARIVRVEGEAPWVIAVRFVSPPARTVETLKRFLWRARQTSGR